MSGLPRHRVTGECCGDSVCSSGRFESKDTCPQDCVTPAASDESASEKKLRLPPTESSLFGKLEGLEHDEYHCEELYNSTGVTDVKDLLEGNPVEAFQRFPCSKYREDSQWLESLLERQKKGTLPFDMPPPGSIAVELGCGIGQDSRNMAKLAKYSVTAIDVSPDAIDLAKVGTPAEMQGPGEGQIEFLAYDAFALPAPQKSIDFFFDATVYCGQRYRFLARSYELWSRILTPGHTLVHMQCWNFEYETLKRNVIPQTRLDMATDFEPLFDVLHSEDCVKNQHGAGWCFYMKLKPIEARQQLFEDRLKMQQAVRDGDLAYVRQNLDKRSGRVSAAEFQTLYYIALDNQHASLTALLKSLSPKEVDPFFEFLYGDDANASKVAWEDRTDGADSVAARVEVEYMRANWERKEAELALENKYNRLKAGIELEDPDTFQPSY